MNLKIFMITISRSLSEESPFEEDLDKLIAIADKATGQVLCRSQWGDTERLKYWGDLRAVDGDNHSSIYVRKYRHSIECITQEASKVGKTGPFWNLTLDGNRNENDEIKVESFIYYL